MPPTGGGRDPRGQARLRQLAEEQAALRRVATLVAQATPPEAVFAAVAEEVGRLLAVDFAILVRYDPQDMLKVIGTWTRTGTPGSIPRVVPAWSASPTASRLWAARSTSTAPPGPGRISQWIFRSSTSWLRVPADVRRAGSAILIPVLAQIRLTVDGHPRTLPAASRMVASAGTGRWSSVRS